VKSALAKPRFAVSFLINNQILKEGDSFEGAKVMRITLEGVELESADLRTKLPISKK